MHRPIDEICILASPLSPIFIYKVRFAGEHFCDLSPSLDFLKKFKNEIKDDLYDCSYEFENLWT